MSNYGPKGLCWDYNADGIPEMTEFGWACQEAKKETEMPAEYGGGTFEDGENKFNHETIKLEQMVPGKTYSYSYKGWPCYAERYATELSKAWSEEYANGAANGIEFYRSLYEKDPTSISVVPTASIAYTYPGYERRRQGKARPVCSCDEAGQLAVRVRRERRAVRAAVERYGLHLQELRLRRFC